MKCSAPYCDRHAPQYQSDEDKDGSKICNDCFLAESMRRLRLATAGPQAEWPLDELDGALISLKDVLPSFEERLAAQDRDD